MATRGRRPGRPRVPVRQQVYRGIRSLIVEQATRGETERLTESQLCEAFAASRMTVRAALAQIEAEGLIARRPGDGTYVHEDYLDHVQELALLATHAQPAPPRHQQSTACLRLGSFEYPQTHRDFWERELNDFADDYPLFDPRMAFCTPPQIADTQLATALPDVFNVHAADIPTLAARGLLLPIGSIADSDGCLDALAPAAVEACRWQGQLWGLPQEVGLPVVYVNEELFAHLDAPPPETWEDWLALAERADRLPTGTTLTNYLATYTLMLYFGVFRPGEWPRATDYDKPAARALLDWLAAFGRHPGAMHGLDGSGQESLARFLSGRMVFLMQGSSIAGHIREFSTFPLRAIRMPAAPGAVRQKVVVAWAMRRDSHVPLHAWRWLRQIVGESCQRRLAARQTNLPVRRDCRVPPPAPRLPGWEHTFAVLAESEVHTLPDRRQYSLEYDVWRAPIVALLSGRQTPAEALASIRRTHHEWEQLWSEPQPMGGQQ